MAILLLAVVLPALLLAGTPASVAAQAPPDLAARLDPLLADPRLAGAQFGVVVRDAASGGMLYERNGAARLIPGSNQKLFVMAAAFAALGPEFRFRTSLLSSGRQRGDVLEGHLYLKGTGDPTMTPARWEELAGRLAALGIRRVRGRLIADDSWFDDVRLGPDWAWNDETFGFAPQISALTASPDEEFDVSSVLVEVSPGDRVGSPAGITVTPATDYVRVVNRIWTEEPPGTGRLFVRREHGANRVVVEGMIPLGAMPVRRAISVWEPTAYAAGVFAAALAGRGIVVEQAPLSGPAPLFARELAAVESVTLGEIAVPFLKLSNNGIAEILVKTLGRRAYGEGSWDAGMRAVGDYLTGLGIDPAGLRLRDGSGLTRLNLATAGAFAALLVAVRSAPWFPFLYEALPVAGAPDRLVGGTLRTRMRGTRAEGAVRAKTGTLTGVSSLSGYAVGEGAAPLVFSIIFNNVLGPAPRDIEDRIAAILAGEPPAAGSSGPDAARPGIGERRQDLLQLLAQRLELRREREALAEMLERLVGGEAGAGGGDLEQDPAGLPEVDGPEVEAVDDRGGMAAALLHAAAPRFVLVHR